MMDIVLSHVSKHFDGQEVLSDVNLVLRGGQTTCLMGPSGIGKTTLMNLLMGLLKPDTGSITGLPGKVGAVFQEDRLCEDFSAIQNVRFATGNKVSPAIIREHLHSLQLPDESLNKSVLFLSGGMRRRVAIARAVLYDAELLILDEAFKGLDDDTRKVAIDHILAHTVGKTVIAVTHESREATLLKGEIIRLEDNMQKIEEESTCDVRGRLPLKVTGVVIGGKKIGRRLGFPTANLSFPFGGCDVDNGVYLARICLPDGRLLPAVLNHGHHPTIPQGPPAVEVHVLDFDEEIYGQKVTVEYLKFTRPEVKFSSREAMQRRVMRDISDAKAWFSSHPA